VGQAGGVPPAGAWYVDWGVAFARDPQVEDLGASDVEYVSLGLYRSNGSAVTGYLATRTGPIDDITVVTVKDGLVTLGIDGELTEPGRAGAIQVKGTLSGRIP
jgi:hypothetical protein